MSGLCPRRIVLLYLLLRQYFKNFMDTMWTYPGHKPDIPDIELPIFNFRGSRHKLKYIGSHWLLAFNYIFSIWTVYL